MKRLTKRIALLLIPSPSKGILFASTHTGLVVQVRPKVSVYDVRGFYGLLGLEPGASISDVKRRAREIAKEHHPDAGGDVDTFMKLWKVVEILLDPVQKEAYDALSADDLFFSQEEMRDMTMMARRHGDVRPIQEILSDVGIELESAVEEEDVVGEADLGYAFYAEPGCDTDRDRELVSEWHGMLCEAAIRCGWESTLRVGIRRSMVEGFDVERRHSGGITAPIFVLSEGVRPTAKMANAAVAYAAAEYDFSRFLTTLATIERQHD